jgi:hypothetical protein
MGCREACTERAKTWLRSTHQHASNAGCLLNIMATILKNGGLYVCWCVLRARLGLRLLSIILLRKIILSTCDPGSRFFFQKKEKQHCAFRAWTYSAQAPYSLSTKYTKPLNGALCILCSEPGSNWRPFPLQGNALPTELSERIMYAYSRGCHCTWLGFFFQWLRLSLKKSLQHFNI